MPVTLRVIAAFPAGTLEGERLLAPGNGLFTVNVATTDGRLPGFAAVTIGVPATAMALAGMLACNSTTLKNVVGTVFPLKVTTKLGVKLLPDTLNVNDGPPAVALAGESGPVIGWTFGLVIVIVAGLEVPPPPEPGSAELR